MDLLVQYAKEIVALLVPFITWLLNSSQRGEPKLIFGVRHGQTFPIPLPQQQAGPPQGPLLLFTGAVMMQNASSKTAKNVELVFPSKPLHILFQPIRERTEVVQPDGSFIVRFGSLAPRELLSFDLISIGQPPPPLSTLRSDECVGKQVTLVPVQQTSPRSMLALRVLFGVGAVATVYLLLVVAQWLFLKTPVVGS